MDMQVGSKYIRDGDILKRDLMKHLCSLTIENLIKIFYNCQCKHVQVDRRQKTLKTPGF